MVPKKKSIDSLNESERNLENEALEQTENPETAGVTKDTENKEESTVLTFNNGMETGKKYLTRTKRNLRSIIAVTVACLIFVGGWLSVGLISNEEENPEGVVNNIPVTNIDMNNIKKVEILTDKKHYEYTPLTQEVEDYDGNPTKETIWELKGYETKLLASSSTVTVIDNVSNMYALRVMEQSMEKKALYGLSAPSITINVTQKEGNNISLLVGDLSPDNAGYYVSVTGDEKIYLVAATNIEKIKSTPEQLANTVIFDAPTIDNIVKKTDKKYFDESSGALQTFESIELSGKKFKNKVKLVPISNNDFVKYTIYSGSEKRFANPNTVETMFSLATNGLVAIDTYVLQPSKAQIKKYGLDNPDYDVTIKCGEISLRVKANFYDKKNNYYAVMFEGRNAIYTVTTDALAMLDYSLKDYYYEFIFQEYIHNFKNISIKTPSKSYSFDIDYDSEEDEITAKGNGKEINSDLLSAYYQYFITLSPEIKDSYKSGKTVLTATFTYDGVSGDTEVMEFKEQSSRRYLVKLNGQNMGIIKSTELDKFIVYAEYVMLDRGIPDPVQ